MKFVRTRYSLWVTAIAVAMATGGCGGGGGAGPVIAPPPPPPPPPAQQKGIEGGGVISRFGANFNSVTVNDQVFDTTAQALTVTVNDQPATVADLSVGNVVRVTATTTDDGVTATAVSIVQINDLKGPIEAGSIDSAAQTFVVLGQTVKVVSTTVFDDDISPRSLAGLAAGERVEISGLFNSDGSVTATRIERDTGATEFEVTGVVSSLDSAAMRFNLGPLLVDYSGATLDDFVGGVIANGDLVEAKGTTIDANGALVATEVDNEAQQFAGGDGDLGEFEGFITRFGSATDFDVAGLPVTTTAQTVYERGTVADLALNARVEVKGTLNANGVLVAVKIEFEDGADAADIEIEAPVESISGGAGGGTGSVTMLGITVTIETATTFEDKSAAQLQPFNLGDLNAGDYVEIEGFAEPPGSANVIAVQLEREDLDNDVSLQGPVDSVAEPNLVIVGVTIATDGNTEYRLADDTPTTRTQFFAQVGSGTLVKAEGSWDGATLTAREIELEN